MRFKELCVHMYGSVGLGGARARHENGCESVSSNSGRRGHEIRKWDISSQGMLVCTVASLMREGVAVRGKAGKEGEQQ
jgi:hypothetical protein